MSSLLRSWEVLVGQMAQGTPPSSARRGLPGGFNRLYQLLHGFFKQVSSEVFSKSSSVMSSLLSLQSPKSCKLQTVPASKRKLLPDPTTAASERSSVKKRLTGCRT